MWHNMIRKGIKFGRLLLDYFTETTIFWQKAPKRTGKFLFLVFQS